MQITNESISVKQSPLKLNSSTNFITDIQRLVAKVFAQLKNTLPAYDVYKAFTEKLREEIVNLKNNAS